MKWSFLIIIFILFVFSVVKADWIYNPHTDNLDYHDDEQHGEIFYVNYTGTELNFAVQSTYYQVWFTNSSHLEGFAFEGGFGTNSNLTAENGGHYLINYMASGDGQNNHEYHTVIFVNEVEKENCENFHKMAAGGDIITQSGSCILELSADDKISLRVADYTGTGTGNYYAGTLNAIRVSD